MNPTAPGSWLLVPFEEKSYRLSVDHTFVTFYITPLSFAKSCQNVLLPDSHEVIGFGVFLLMPPWSVSTGASSQQE